MENWTKWIEIASLWQKYRKQPQNGRKCHKMDGNMWSKCVGMGKDTGKKNSGKLSNMWKYVKYSLFAKDGNYVQYVQNMRTTFSHAKKSTKDDRKWS